jgi:hypothetical protein
MQKNQIPCLRLFKNKFYLLYAKETIYQKDNLSKWSLVKIKEIRMMIRLLFVSIYNCFDKNFFDYINFIFSVDSFIYVIIKKIKLMIS